jgi:hypothetical protein
MSSEKYRHLINVLDKVAQQAPDEFKSYRYTGNDQEKINKIRSKAYIHLLLLSKFGLTDFKERERYITDGTNDGGIDAFYIDDDYKIIYFVQSKYRANAGNFEEKEIRFEELLAMEVDRIMDGSDSDTHGTKYNGKIQSLIKHIRGISDIVRYQYKIIILANVKEVSREKLFRLSGGFPTEVINHEKSYNDILFPVLAGSFFNSPHLFIHLNLSNKQSGTKISYSVGTSAGTVDITVVFVPTIEIAKTLSKYKNSILKYNPRCYLEFSESKINPEIIASITNNPTNEFALYNNGITMISEETSINERIGLKDRAQLLVKNPQIINGGQTAYALSRVLENNPDSYETIFNSKEVLLKIITINDSEIEEQKSLQLIESISNATNQQNLVTYADRHSNDRVQLAIQKAFYQKYGILYERKRGEFADAISYGYIDSGNITSRSEILRISRAIHGDLGRKQSGKKYFNNDTYYKRFFKAEDIDKYYFGYVCFRSLQIHKESEELRSDASDRALRFGPQFIIHILSKILPIENQLSKDEIESHVSRIIEKWIDFEKYITNSSKNEKYYVDKYDKVSEETIKVFQYRKYYYSNDAIEDMRLFFIENEKHLTSA